MNTSRWQRRGFWLLGLLAALVVAALVAGTLLLLRERDRARQEAETTRAVSQFVTSLFEAADPGVADGQAGITAIELLDKGRQRLSRDLQTQPATRRALLAVLADVYERVARARESADLFGEAAKDEPDPLRRAQLLARQSLSLANEGDSKAAEAPAREALALRRQHAPGDDMLLGDVENRLAVALTGQMKLDEAAALLESALARFRSKGEEGRSSVASALHNLARVRARQERLDEAEALFRESVQVGSASRQRGPRHNQTLVTREQLAILLRDRGRLGEAEAEMMQALQARVAVWGPHSAHVAMVLNELGVLQQDAGRAAEAVASHQKALDIRRQQTGSRSFDTAISLHNLGKAQQAVGDVKAAEVSLRESLSVRRQLAGGTSSAAVQRAQVSLSRLLLALQRHDEAAALLNDVAQARASLAPSHVDRATVSLMQAEVALARQRPADARGLIEPLAAGLAKLPAAQRAEFERLQGLLAWSDGRRDDAMARLEAAWQQERDRQGSEHPSLLAPGLEWHQRLHAAGRRDEAAALVGQLAAAARRHVPASPWRREWERRAGRPAGAAPA